MPFRFAKTSLLFFLSIGICSAQDSASSAGTSTPAPTPDASTSSALEYLSNRKPADGSIAKEAVDANRRVQEKAQAQDAIGVTIYSDPVFVERFKRYLGVQEISQGTLDLYFSTLADIESKLKDNKLIDAWRELYELGANTNIDAGVSKELANQIESVWNTGKAQTTIDKENDKLRRDIRAAHTNADMMSDAIVDKDIEVRRKLRQIDRNGSTSNPVQPMLPNGGVPMENSGTSTTPTPDTSAPAMQGRLRLTEEYLRALELKAKIKVNELRQEKLLDEAKKAFAEYVTTLFASGRLNHVILAANFYRRIFEEGDYPPDMAKQVTAAREIDRDVRSTVEVFRYKVSKDEMAGATECLQQAFLASELNPAVLGLERPLKEKVEMFLRDLERVRNLIEARDFGTLASILDKLKGSAVDFDSTKALAMVNAVKLQSKMHLGKAKLAAQSGDNKLAMEEFQAAAAAWPGNPDLEDKAVSFFDTQDVKNKALTDFDRLIEEENLRAIFEKQLVFAPAVAGDQKREEQLKKALESIQRAEMATEKANLLMLNGDVFGAWETIELASDSLPDDKKLNKLRADLSGKSAQFVATVNRAKDAEAKGAYGYSLAWYANAQRQYPSSQFANQGIDRMRQKLLGEAQ